MSEHGVVHGPELALLVRGNRGRSGEIGLRMGLERELLENQFNLGWVGLEKRIDFTDRNRTVGTLEIGKFDHGDLGVRGSDRRRTSDWNVYGVVEKLWLLDVGPLRSI